MAVIWRADGELAGPTNSPHLEWTSYAGWGDRTAPRAHPGIQLVTAGDKGEPPLQGKYMYRHQFQWWHFGKGTGATDSYFGDRLEMQNERVGRAEPPVDTDPAEGQPAVGCGPWGPGTDIWFGFAFMIPEWATVAGGEPGQKEVHWSLDQTGLLGFMQLHWHDGHSAPLGGAIRGTHHNHFGFPVPVIEIAQGELWRDSAEVVLGRWYRFIFHVVTAPSYTEQGTVELWADKGDGAGMVKRGTAKMFLNKAEDESQQTLFPCQGCYRNEEHKPPATEGEAIERYGAEIGPKAYADRNLIPPEQVYYMDAWTFATTKLDIEEELYPPPEKEPEPETIKPEQHWLGGFIHPTSVVSNGTHIWVSDAEVTRLKADGTGREPKWAGNVISGTSLTLDSNYVYWNREDEETQAIGRIKLDGTSPEPNWIPLPEESRVGPVAVDSEHVYFTVGGNIARAKLDGTGLELNWCEGLTVLRAELIVFGGFLYYEDLKHGGQVSRITLPDPKTAVRWLPAANAESGKSMVATASSLYLRENTSLIARWPREGAEESNATLSIGTDSMDYGTALGIDSKYIYWAAQDKTDAGFIGRAPLSLKEEVIAGSKVPINEQSLIQRVAQETREQTQAPASSEPKPPKAVRSASGVPNEAQGYLGSGPGS